MKSDKINKDQLDAVSRFLAPLYFQSVEEQVKWIKNLCDSANWSTTVESGGVTLVKIEKEILCFVASHIINSEKLDKVIKIAIGNRTKKEWYDYQNLYLKWL